MAAVRKCAWQGCTNDVHEEFKRYCESHGVELEDHIRDSYKENIFKYSFENLSKYLHEKYIPLSVTDPGTIIVRGLRSIVSYYHDSSTGGLGELIAYINILPLFTIEVGLKAVMQEMCVIEYRNNGCSTCNDEYECLSKNHDIVIEYKHNINKLWEDVKDKVVNNTASTLINIMHRDKIDKIDSCLKGISGGEVIELRYIDSLINKKSNNRNLIIEYETMMSVIFDIENLLKSMWIAFRKSNAVSMESSDITNDNIKAGGTTNASAGDTIKVPVPINISGREVIDIDWLNCAPLSLKQDTLDITGGNLEKLIKLKLDDNDNELTELTVPAIYALNFLANINRRFYGNTVYDPDHNFISGHGLFPLRTDEIVEPKMVRVDGVVYKYEDDYHNRMLYNEVNKIYNSIILQSKYAGHIKLFIRDRWNVRPVLGDKITVTGKAYVTSAIGTGARGLIVDGVMVDCVVETESEI